MSTRPFIITGCARSGTAYTAKLLTAAGVPCTHEEIFSLSLAGRMTAGHAGGVHNTTFENVGEALGCKGESSWLAAPLLDKLPENILVFHQLRNPLHVIRSLMRRKFFHPDRGTGRKYGEYAKRWMEKRRSPLSQENIGKNDPPIVQYMKYWLRWNLFVSAEMGRKTTCFSYRVEDLSAGQLVFPTMLRMITGSWVPSSTDFFDRVPVGVNHASVETDAEADAISWSDLPEIPAKRTLERMASVWGYRTEDLLR